MRRQKLHHLASCNKFIKKYKKSIQIANQIVYNKGKRLGNLSDIQDKSVQNWWNEAFCEVAGVLEHEEKCKGFRQTSAGE